MCVHHDAAKHECDHLHAVKKTWIHTHAHLKICLAIRAPRFVVDHTIEDAPVCDAASWVTTAIVSELSAHASANVVELFVQTLVVLKTPPILDLGLVTGLHDSLRPCG
ncbi:hypothetical protein TNCV_3847141 [Trichonephila clavipes]|nr:hypothetical protein TNCV_3847141 [Trichonephila clavipes]